jgi:hypothetical protein
VKHVETLAVAAQGYADFIRQYLQSLQPGISSAGRAAAATAAAAIEQTIHGFAELRSCNCHGCGNEALSLRKCGRCKQAQYCRYVGPCSC